MAHEAARPAKPLRRDAERNRERILAAARVVFAERGLCASLDEVARHAGVGVATVYRRFPDKEQLIGALFEERIAEITTIIEAALAEPDPRAGFEQFFFAVLDAQSHDRGLKEAILGSAHGGARLAQARADLEPGVSELLLRAQRAGVVREDVAPTDIPLMHMMVGTVMDAAEASDPELWRRYARVLLDGLRPGAPEGELPHSAPCPDVLDAAMRAYRPMAGRRVEP